jgi:hypothetical protein
MSTRPSRQPGHTENGLTISTMTRAKWLLIGGETLPAKRSASWWRSASCPSILMLASAEASERILTESDGELFVIAPLDAVAVEEATVLILAGATADSRLAREMVKAAQDRPILVDATGALEESAGGASVRTGVGAYARARREVHPCSGAPGGRGSRAHLMARSRSRGPWSRCHGIRTSQRAR